MGGGRGDGLIEYNPPSNTWRVMPSLQDKRWRRDSSVCSLDNKIFVLGGDTKTCEMIDFSEALCV